MEIRIRETESVNKFDNFKIDCQQCFGLCCVALYFSKMEGFPIDKVAGKPCINLKTDYSCSIHSKLIEKGLKGCTAYDCFGAGQKVAQTTFQGVSWSNSVDVAKEMFDVFIIMRQLHEMLWYLNDAFTFVSQESMKKEIELMIFETVKITNLDSKTIKTIDIDKHRIKVNSILKTVSETVKTKVASDYKRNSRDKKILKKGYDFIGANLTNTNLIGANFAGALLIAANMKNVNLKGANLIGADLRDADICGANLKDVMFLSQAQINTAKGDSKTKLPKSLVRPTSWAK